MLEFLGVVLEFFNGLMDLKIFPTISVFGILCWSFVIPLAWCAFVRVR